MQQLRSATDARDARACAREIVDVVPSLMLFIRQVSQPRRGKGISIQQFRALAYLRRRPGDSMSDVGDYLGLTLPAASRMIDAMVKRDLVRREPVPENRRQVQLRLTTQGAKLFDAAVSATMEELERRLRPLGAARRKCITDADRKSVV